MTLYITIIIISLGCIIAGYRTDSDNRLGICSGILLMIVLCGSGILYMSPYTMGRALVPVLNSDEFKSYSERERSIFEKGVDVGTQKWKRTSGVVPPFIVLPSIGLAILVMKGQRRKCVPTRQ